MKALAMVMLWAVPVLAQEASTISQAELMLRTQALYDGVDTGDKAPWQKYLADDAMVHDEKGDSYNRTTMIETIEPLPPGYTSHIVVVKPQTIFAPGVAIFAYEADEVETVFGNRVTARYQQTDTWLYRAEKWQIAASQVMRYYADPASIALKPALLAEYAGTYELAPANRVVVTVRDGKLYAQRNAGKAVEMFAEAPDLFFRAGVEGRRLFRRDDQGKVIALIDRRNNEDMVLRKVG